MKNLSFDLVRATEAGAIAAAKLICSGDKLAIDREATKAIRGVLNSTDFAGYVTIGEGIKDQSEGLLAGEYVGKGGLRIAAELAGGIFDQIIPKPYSLATDVVDGTTQTSIGGPEAVSVLALAEYDGFYPTEHHYMMKMAYGPKIQGFLPTINDSPQDVVRWMQLELKYPPVVCILNRPRHEQLIKDYRKAGARLKIIQDCDVSAALATCLENSGIDLYVGIGGASEAVLAAAAIKCLGGHFEAYLVDNKSYAPQNNGHLKLDDLVRSHCLFAATGITNGSILRGVKFNKKTITNTVLMSSEDKVVRWLTTEY